MFDPNRNTHSLGEFTQHSEEYARHICETRSPVVLTVDGRPELVVQDAESYQALLDAVERAETIESVQRGLDQMKRGEGRPAGEAFAEIRRSVRD